MKSTFENEGFNFEVDVLGNGKLVVLEFLGDFVKDHLALPGGSFHEIFKDFLESIELNVLLVDFLIDYIEWGKDFLKMFMFLGFGQVELVFDGLEFLEDFGELLMFLVFEVVFEWVQLVKKDVGTFFVISLGSEVGTWDEGQVFGTDAGAVDLRVHLWVIR